MHEIQLILPKGTVRPDAPVSPGVRCGSLLFVSGQVARDSSGVVVEGGVREQFRAIVRNLHAVLEEGGSSLRDVLKTTVFLTNISDMAEMNRAYSETFGDHRPARSTVEVSALGRPEFVIEMEAVARVMAPGVSDAPC